MSKDSFAYGCIFCKTGSEDTLALALRRTFPEIEVLIAEKKRMRRQGGKLIEEQVRLFPGYLFFRAEASVAARKLVYHEDVYRVLCDANGRWQLCGEDEAFVRALFECSGVIGLSKAYYEGDRIRIKDGMLKMYEGRIQKVNRRSGTAQVSVGLPGQEVTAWLGFELMDDADE